MKKNKEVSEYLATIGSKGGKSTSPAKQAASRANGSKGKGTHPKIRPLKVPCPVQGYKITNGHEHVDAA
jgi:hypothetical protein